jgi:hypothetical protein
MSIEKDLQDGDAANRILSDEFFVSLVSGLKQDLLNRIALTDPSAAEVRESTYFEIRGIDSILMKLKALADNGLYARRQREKA